MAISWVCERWLPMLLFARMASYGSCRTPEQQPCTLHWLYMLTRGPGPPSFLRLCCCYLPYCCLLPAVVPVSSPTPASIKPQPPSFCPKTA